MKNTSIFIPLLLIGCLAALIYLFFAALRAAEEDDGRQQDPIVLNEDDYRNPADDPATLDTLKGEISPADTGLFTDVPAGEKEPASVPATTTQNTPTTTTPPATTTNPTTTPTTTDTQGGRYLVIAGTFSQLAGAQDRVAALRTAGFEDATVEKFNRGKYAVALAGQSDSYRTASALAERIKSRGFEVRVMKRR
jgi:cell division septation protein DedD